MASSVYIMNSVFIGTSLCTMVLGSVLRVGWLVLGITSLSRKNTALLFAVSRLGNRG